MSMRIAKCDHGPACPINSESVADRLEYLRSQIEAERISWFEIAELQGLAEHIDPADVQLLEWADPEGTDPTLGMLGVI